MRNMYECFLQRDCLNITINPLALTAKHDLIGVNCRIEIDDNAEYRQQEMFAINDKSQIVFQERVAKQWDLCYYQLDGNIGVISNSAGECLATNDLIELHGGKAANFCDLKGSAYREQIEAIVHQLNDDP